VPVHDEQAGFERADSAGDGRVARHWSSEADEVAQAVTMVIGNSYMTGQTIVLNGGMAFI
jgi:hypothetical protein